MSHSQQPRPQSVTFRYATAVAVATGVDTAAEAERVGIAGTPESLPPERRKVKRGLKVPGVAKSLQRHLEIPIITVLAAGDQGDSMIAEEVVGLE